MIRHLPPVGLPLGGKEVWGALAGIGHPDESALRFAEELALRLSGRTVIPLSSGRAALLGILEAARAARPGRTDVLVPAYTCWSVPAAVIRAGLTVRLYDVDPATLDARRETIETDDRVLAVLSNHLFGIPNDMHVLQSAADSCGAFLIDDAAQGFGATWDGIPIGAWGDAGLLSFGRGKGLPALGGGAIVVPAEGPLAESLANTAGRGSGRGAGRFAKAWSHGFFFRPERYHFPAELPFLHIGETTYEPAFRSAAIDGYTAALGLRLLPRLDEANAARQARADRYASFGSSASYRPVSIGERGGPVYLRYPIMLRRDLTAAEEKAAALLGVSRLYPAPVQSIPGLPADALRTSGTLEGSEEIARKLRALPTHPLVGEDDQTALRDLLHHESGGRSS
ncbi:MAG: DegT/DnrJ/EryC1/StrS aminotransferase family protein [Gemmatimonadetes bacterium]|nr:DegT/DnrJ/EryC1/StrS aminotransferase family protein [Gemmatimonadota bacterium]